MNKYFFVLGRSFDLCKAELEVLLAPFSVFIDRVIDHVVIVNSACELDLQLLVERSGGIVKGGVIFHFDRVSISDISAPIVSYLVARFGSQKFRFGLSGYGEGFSQRFIHAFILRLSGILHDKALQHSYILPQDSELSSVQVHTYRLDGFKGADIVLVRDHEFIFYGITHIVQPYYLWSQFDYGRPCRDAHSGMLPPKVARMMLHLGLGELFHSRAFVSDTPLVYDPFCGSGTVLTEAIRLGCRIVGSDISEKAILSTRQNLDWTVRSRFYTVHSGERDSFFGYFHTLFDSTSECLFVSDVSHAPKFLSSLSPDLIVTEPYLGPAFTAEPTLGKIERIVKGLQKMYIGAFAAFRTIQSSGGVLVFAEPVYFGHNQTYTVGILDKSLRYGYTLKSKIFSYGKAHSFVGRKIAVLARVS